METIQIDVRQIARWRQYISTMLLRVYIKYRKRTSM